MQSPFEGFLSNIYKSRQEARAAGDEGMAYVYNNLLNTLYGRLGINPESTAIDVCGEEKYDKMLRKESFKSAEMLTEEQYLVSYTTNSILNEEWNPPRFTAVHYAAAITAEALIFINFFLGPTAFIQILIL